MIFGSNNQIKGQLTLFIYFFTSRLPWENLITTSVFHNWKKISAFVELVFKIKIQMIFVNHLRNEWIACFVIKKYRYISCFYLKLKLKTTIFIRIQITYSSFLFLFQCQSFIHSFNVVSSTWTISCLNARYKNIKETEAHLQATPKIRFAYILWFAIMQILQSSNLFFISLSFEKQIYIDQFQVCLKYF